MSKRFSAAAFTIGCVAVAWVGLGFIGTSWLALAVTAVIAGVYLLGAHELRQFRATTQALAAALHDVPQPLASLADWLERVPVALRNAVRLRVEGERMALPGPALTPYLVGLLVMLGMLGTFLGMVVTFKGAVFALEGSTDLQAIRSALSEPIKGLGLSFGTSVAGVAASAMLGLMSAIARRERMDVARTLDTRIATVLRPFSRSHQRQETFHAVQLQAHALPQVAEQLAALMARIEQRSEQLDAQLLERQAVFQREVTQAYAELADTVGASLKDSLAAGARAAGETLQPVVASTMATLAQESTRLHQRLGEVAQAQVDAVSQRFEAAARSVSENWSAALQQQGRTSEAMADGLRQSLDTYSDNFERRSAGLLASIEAQHARMQSQQAGVEHERLKTWTEALQALAGDMKAQWQRVGDLAAAQQQAIGAALAQTAEHIAEHAGAQARRTLDEVSALLAQTQDLVRSRTEAEARFAEQQAGRMDQLAGVWRSELAALREQERAQGEAAVQRLAELQDAVAQHLASLGTSLEAPMTRLMHSASEVPQAAAGVITELRQEMSRLAERDNLALQERTVLLEQLGTLLRGVNEASAEQRAAVESLVASAASVFESAGQQFGNVLAAQGGQAAEVAAHVTASAVELASLGEAFGQGVQSFQATSDKLVETLQRIEGSLNRSTARSDEQLAYYVAQAREVIDLSIASQQGLVEHLRQLQVKPIKTLALAGEAAAG
jgi:hypothetical protein